MRFLSLILLALGLMPLAAAAQTRVTARSQPVVLSVLPAGRVDGTVTPPPSPVTPPVQPAPAPRPQPTPQPAPAPAPQPAPQPAPGPAPALITADVTAPTIQITEPQDGVMRGGQNIILQRRAGQSVTVRGTVTDDRGLAGLTIAGNDVPLEAGGLFAATVPVVAGLTRIDVRALDRAGNEATVSIRVGEGPPAVAPDAIIAGNYRALVIGIDRYTGAWGRLRTAVNDARTVASVLKEQYGFAQVDTLYNENASRVNIISAMEQLSRESEPTDHVLIYYAGHGELVEAQGNGYWVPADAHTNSTAGYIPNQQVVSLVRGIRSQHVLLVADACFAGDMLMRGGSREETEQSDSYFARMERRASRKIMTSGGVEQVADSGREGHSVFAYYFLRTLRQNTNRFMAASDIYNEVERLMSSNAEQEPMYAPIRNAGDERGEFIFRRTQQ